jgi:hypothetical protein
VAIIERLVTRPESAASSEASFAITPSDSVNFTYAIRGIYVGGTGNIVVVNENGSTVTFSNVPVGLILPVRCIRVNSTSTTATLMVGLY